MKRHFIICFVLLFAISVKSQTADQLFKPAGTKITWLGIDFSHVKLIGNFSQFNSAGEKSTVQIRDRYFYGWNHLLMSYPKKFDIKGMLHRDDINYDLNMMTAINFRTILDSMESLNVPNYTLENIKGFVNQYPIENKDGIGVLFVAECLNKAEEDAWFHFVAINMKTKEILIQQRIRGVPNGIGLKNYWASAIYDAIKEVRKKYYKVWWKKYK